MFWIGSFWREDEPTVPAARGAAALPIGRVHSPTNARRLAVALAVVAAAFVWRPIGAAVDARYQPHAPVLAPVPAGAGWAPVGSLPRRSSPMTWARAPS